MDQSPTMIDCYELFNELAPLSPASDEWMMYSSTAASTAPLTASTSFTGYFDSWNDTKPVDILLVTERLQSVEEERRNPKSDLQKTTDLNTNYTQKNSDFGKMDDINVFSQRDSMIPNESMATLPGLEYKDPYAHNEITQFASSTEMPKSTICPVKSEPSENVGDSRRSSSSSTHSLDEKQGCKKKRERKKLTSDQKIAHNKIEKKYRVNINTKILGLAEVVPSLNGACRLNKLAILERAAEYIMELRAENERLRTK